jgi:hypothetical protein
MIVVHEPFYEREWEKEFKLSTDFSTIMIWKENWEACEDFKQVD